ncbi:MAG: NAD(P)H-quinone oxidoreductase subunit N [Kaiparowitsia implicata GSE-PSE-MK54-09C]|jgi:NAD(P)H-quinone oxidoreductase subunit N|nr:NAD(P)H-quinone oxidoreductase subunit N [Kaiparowitsia implicata GSE-PSE-MK54-09C]
MALIITGKKFTRELEQAGALGIYVPPEGGEEGRYQRRVRGAGYDVLTLTARGLGDLSSYLLNVHGVRPAHLGKKNLGREGAVGYRYYIPPIVTYELEKLPPKSKGLVLWLIEGVILAPHELEFLVALPQLEPRVKVVVEMGGDRDVVWKPLSSFVSAA